MPRKTPLLSSMVGPGVPEGRAARAAPGTSHLHHLCLHRTPAAPHPQTMGPAQGAFNSPKKDRAKSQLRFASLCFLPFTKICM